MLNQKDLKVISILRANARETLTNISKITNIPISTLYDKLKLYNKSIVKKHTSLLDFPALGFYTRANIVIRVNKNSREAIKGYLIKNQNINSLYKVNNSYDFMIEAVFKHIKELEDFIDKLEKKFEIEDKQIYYIIEDIQRENFMANINLLDL